MAGREQASIGASQNYGPRETNEGLPDTVSTYGLVKQLELYMDFAQVNAGLPTLNADTDAGTLVIPANSLLVRAYLEVGVAFTSGGSATLELGVQTVAGGVVDAGSMHKLHPRHKNHWKEHFAEKGVLTSDEIQQKIDTLPKTKYNVSFSRWDDHMQNINNRSQVVLRMDHSDESVKPAIIISHPNFRDVFSDTHASFPLVRSTST